ncbi:hypothetical protein CTheo_4681 [Ceratobasidium theobromae]|uniref:Uncharacterized protein n=1 Tax=Ceratobasidium theobromae TaxID=1582974 RepID=A0A5N5QK32_9AGAM|nr:hypothetical protein CTheo_4681 [Ceratobasidium theobromae]
MALVLPPLTGPMVSQPAHSYPVTESIHTLIQHISSEVSSLRRNMHTMCKLVEVARGLHDRINQSIHEVDQTGDWEVYDTYTQAIDPLEEALLELIPAIYEEQEPMIPRSDEQCTKLQDNEIESSSAYKHDDQTLLHNLVKRIYDNKLKITHTDTRISLKTVWDKLEHIKNIQTSNSKSPIDEELVTLSIECAMIIYGVTELLLDGSISPKLRDRLQSPAMWQAAKQLVGHLEHTQGAASGKLEKEYQDFEEILLGLKKVNPPPVIHVHSAPAPTTAPVFPKVGAHSWVAGSRLPGTGSGQFLFGMSIRVAASPTSPSGYGHGF